MSIKQAIEALEVAQDALDISQSLQESAKSNHHPKTLAAYQRVSAALAALRSMPAEPFPPRIMKLLVDVADRECKGSRGPWQDGDGEPLQDDADAAIAWINRATPPTAPVLSDAEIQAIWSAKDTSLQQSTLTPFGMDRIRAIERAVIGRAGGGA